MKRIVSALLVLGLALGLGTAQDARAHSRKGLVKIPLVSSALTVDQVAYYLEGKVNKRLDDKGRKYRFTIWEFDAIEMDGDLARIHVQINDQKTASRTPEVLYLRRNPDDTWNHVDEAGALITEGIYTMVMPDYGMYYTLGGCAGLLVLVAGMVYARRRKAAKRLFAD